MPRITKVYTRGGDKGLTGLAGGQRVPKNSLRVEAYGTVDELNAILGIVLVYTEDPTLHASLKRLQNELFHLGADLCMLEEDKEKYPIPHIEEKHIIALEEYMDQWAEILKPLEEFILPGGSKAAAYLHLARTVCRRAERIAIALAETETIGAMVIAYLNRLSDVLFVMSRVANHLEEVSDIFWDQSL